MSLIRVVCFSGAQTNNFCSVFIQLETFLAIQHFTLVRTSYKMFSFDTS